MGQVAHALLTRPPLSHLNPLAEASGLRASFDLHVLGTPPAFILSQDQTLTLSLYLFQDLAGLVSFITLSVLPNNPHSSFKELFGVASLFSCQGSLYKVRSPFSARANASISSKNEKGKTFFQKKQMKFYNAGTS